MRIKLTKLKEAENPRHPNNIEEGYVLSGEIDKSELKIGQSLTILRDDVIGWDRIWATSVIQEVIDENTFRTLNSIYKIEYLD